MQKLAAGEDPLKAFSDAADAAEAGAAATKTMMAQVIYNRPFFSSLKLQEFRLASVHETFSLKSVFKLQAGRSSYVPEHILATVPDPGAMAAAQWLKAAAKALLPSP